MSGTPRTDAHAGYVMSTTGPNKTDTLVGDINGHFVHADFARELERENARLREVLAECCDALRPMQDGVELAQAAGAAPWFRWAYAAVCALAVKLLEEDNRTCGDNWPAGQSWDELGGSSKSIYLHRARELAGISHADFLALVRADSEEVEDIYEAGRMPNTEVTQKHDCE